MSGEKAVQGQDPRGDIFSGLAAILYAAVEPTSPSYGEQSRLCAAIAAARSGLRGARVLDVGCGFGTTTLAISRYAPAEIVAVDSSPAFADLYRTVLESDRDLDAYLAERHAHEVLGDLYPSTLASLTQMRLDFRTGVFRRRGGMLRIVQKSSLDLMLKDTGGPVDVIIGNNFLHWPVNQRRAVLKEQGWDDQKVLGDAVRQALAPLAGVLRQGGLLVLLEPKDFVSSSDDASEEDLERETMSAHPVFRKMHGLLNGILLERHGIRRAIPSTTGLFPEGGLAALFRGAGFMAPDVLFTEATIPGDVVDAFFVRLPMVLGAVALPVEEKLALAREVREKLPALLTEEDRTRLVRGEHFVFVATKA